MKKEEEENEEIDNSPCGICGESKLFCTCGNWAD